MNDLTDDMKAMLSPQELAAINETPEPEEKPAPTQTLAPAFPDPTAAPAPEAKADEPAASAPAAETPVAAPATQEIDPVFDDDAPLHIPVGDIDKLKTEKQAVAEKLEAVAAQAENGEITAAEAIRQSSALTAQLGELSAAIKSEEKAVEQNDAALANFYKRSIDKFMSQKENAEFYVKDTPQYEALDVALKTVGQSPANQNKSLAWVIREADRVARAMTQPAKAAPAPTPAVAATPATPAPDRKQTVPIPATIAAIPPSSEEAVGSEFAYIDNLTGVAREQALAKLTPEQMSRYAAFA